MKTAKGWHKSGLNLDAYLTAPCGIDEDLYNYLGEIVPPKYCSRGFIQMGEAEYSDSYGTMYYMTAICLDDKYFYIGILPEFKQ